ncbi:hypothetical protein COLO4_22890 [Corchorus olitorius]|uniref:t-SNARE coiled-coil homology domain-containing protein n=1 Tax=Corchorus olitorius TaxID=93759 RepID=A0A1R3IJ94_9ROSI|nr:hypothetical protein COLO4_22890 [Corchorus olitorius]
MTVIDIIFRVDEICKKYEKYDVEKQRELAAFSDDAFAALFTRVEDDIDKALAKSEMATTEKNRAAAVAMCAEVRRLKARIIEEIPKLQKLAKKKVKGMSKEDQEARFDLVIALPDRIRAIPDGPTPGGIKTGERGASSSNKNIIFDSTDDHLDSNFYNQTEESEQFREEYEMRKMKQDEGLDIISEGLDTLKNIAMDMNEEMDKQVPLMDEIDTKVDKATSDLQRTNVRLKKTLHDIRSSRNFCIDIIMLCVILGIASYLYNILK